MDPEIQYDDEWKRKRELANARVRKHREWKRREAELLKSMTQDKAIDEIRKQKIQEMDVQRREELARERWKRDQEDILKIEEKNLQQRRELAKERSRRYRERKRIEAEQLKSTQDKAEDEIRKREIQEMSNQRRKELARGRWSKDQEDKTIENNLQQRRELAKERSRRYRERKRLHRLKTSDRVNHDSQIPGPSHGNEESKIYIPLVTGDDPENVNSVEDDCAGLSRVGNFVMQEDQENLLSPCKEENLPTDFDDDIADQACASPTSNAQFNGSSATCNSSKEIEDEDQNQSYKWCCVPSCNNTTKNSPNQIFIHVPNCQEKRVLCSNLFCCEDHLDLTENVANYGYHKLMGGRIFMKPSIVPAKLQYQLSLRDQSTDGTVDIKEEKLVVEPFTATEVASSSSISSRTSPDASTSKEPVFVKVERHSPVDFEEFSEDPLSNSGAKRQKLLVDSSNETGISVPLNSSKETQAASMSWTSVFIKDEPHSPVKDEEGSANPLFDDKKRTTVEIGVQADIKPEYVSMATNCNLDSEEPI